MKIIVTSHNPVKIGAVQDAFGAAFPDAVVAVEPLAVPSGVAEQPMSDEETRRGARQRVARARERLPDADYWVGLEGGLEWLDGLCLASAWMAVMDVRGRIGEARTPTLPLPPRVSELVRGGLELGEANDRVFGTRDSKTGAGAFGLLTGGRRTRRTVYAETLELALIPLTHELWRPPS
jgi:inosine/xanthosine triphosphatase